MKKIIFSFCVLLAYLSCFSQNRIEEFKKKLPDIEKTIELAIKEWNVPALGIAIVTDTSEILVTSYGIKDISKHEKADKNTLFAIASNTKAFTAAAIATLVDEKKISWDDKVVKYIQDFQLYNPYVSQELTIRDLLCHRSGLETFSGDLLWYGSTYSRSEIIKRARFLKPKYPFRTTFGYSNILFLTAGEIIPALTNKSWDQYLKEKFFVPLGMTRTVTSTDELKNMDNIAAPHTEFNGTLITIPYLNWDNIAPAGSIITSPSDIAKWLQLQLCRGKFNGKTIFSKESSWEMWSQHTVENVNERSKSLWPSTHFKGYALGWEVFDYNGRKIVSHNGGYDGMISNTTIIPEEHFAFIIMTNSNSILYYPLTYMIMDEFLGGEKADKNWLEFFLNYTKKKKENDTQERKDWVNKRIKNTKPSLPLSEYCGIYESELYGNAEIKMEGSDKIKLTLLPSPKFNSVLTHWHYDTFEVLFPEFPSLPHGNVTFRIGKDAMVEEMKIDVPNPDFDFTELEFIKKK